MLKFTPPTRKGARFKPPAQVNGRTGASFRLHTREAEKPKTEADGEVEPALPAVGLNYRFLGRYR